MLSTLSADGREAWGMVVFMLAEVSVSLLSPQEKCRSLNGALGLIRCVESNEVMLSGKTKDT